MTRTFRSRRLALVGAVLVLGLSACGTSDGTGSAPTSSVLAPQVIEVAGSAGTAGRASAPTAADAETGVASTKMMAYLQYVFQGDAPDLTSASASWEFPTGVTATDDQLRALAAAFGVAGDPQDVPADMGGGRVIGSTDYTGASVTVGTDALLSWWYNPGSDGQPTVEPCSYYPPGDPMADPATSDLPVCEEPTPPANVPTEAEAEAEATALFTSLGLDPSQWAFDTYADEWGAYVTASYLIDGVTTSLTASIGYGGEGVVTWASGFLATPQRSADYPRIGVDAAVQRLNDQNAMWMSGVGPMSRAEDGIAVGAGVAGASGSAVAVSASAGAATVGAPAVAPPDTGDGEQPSIDPAVEPLPAPPIDCTTPIPVDAPVTVDTGLVLGSSGAVSATEVAPGAATAPAPIDCVPQPPVDCVTDVPLGAPVPETAVPDATATDGTIVGVDATSAVVPLCLPVPEPEPMTITLTTPTASLEQVWAADGTVWLLPGYRFDTTDGSFVTVVAVEDQYLQQAQPEIVPVDTLPVDTVTVDTVTVTPDTAVTEPSGPMCAGLPTAITEPGLSVQVGDIIVGMCTDDAAAFIAGYTPGASMRVVREDGVDLAVTADVDPLRVNVVVTDGVVTEVISLG